MNATFDVVIDDATLAFDTVRVMKLIEETTHARRIELLEGIVAMLTKMI